MRSTPGWLYVLACVTVPALWGIVMYHLFGWWDRRRKRRASEELPHVDYTI